MNQFYYADNEEQPKGPFLRSDLEKLFEDGALNGETLIIREGEDNWESYRSLFGSARSREFPSPSGMWFINLLMGLLLCVLRNLTFPFLIIRNATNEVVKWGENREVPVVENRVTLSYLSNSVVKFFIVMISLLAVADAVLIPLFSHSILLSLISSNVSSFVLANAELSERIGMMILLNFWVYFFAIPMASLIGELLNVLVKIGNR